MLKNSSIVFSKDTNLCFKIMIVGEKFTGKTSLIIRFVKGIFQQKYKITLGTQFYSKIIMCNDKQLAFQIWDTAGTQQYKSLIRSLYNHTHCIILAYDSKSNLNQYVEKWISQIKQKAMQLTRLVLIRTKTDEQPMDDQQQLKIDDLLKNHPIDIFIPVSAKNNSNITELFQKIGQLLVFNYFNNQQFQNINNNSKRNQTIVLKDFKNIEKQVKKKNKCCKG